MIFKRFRCHCRRPVVQCSRQPRRGRRYWPPGRRRRRGAPLAVACVRPSSRRRRRSCFLSALQTPKTLPPNVARSSINGDARGEIRAAIAEVCRMTDCRRSRDGCARFSVSPSQPPAERVNTFGPRTCRFRRQRCCVFPIWIRLFQ